MAGLEGGGELKLKSFEADRINIINHSKTVGNAKVSAVVNNDTSSTSKEIIASAAAVLLDIYHNTRKDDADD